MSYTIGEVAEMMGVTPSTLRYYDQEGFKNEFNRLKDKLNKNSYGIKY